MLPPPPEPSDDIKSPPIKANIPTPITTNNNPDLFLILPNVAICLF